VLFSVVVIDLIGFGIVVPILPFYARTYGASGLALGALLTSYAAMQLMCAPLWGRLSDRVGRRPVMLITIAGTGVSLLGLGLADSLAALFVARVLGGAFAANISVATAYVGDVTEPEERTRWMGMVGASFAVGFLVGPALGGLLAPVQTEAGLRFTLLGPALGDWLSPFGYGIPMLFAAGLALLNLLHAFRVLQEPVVHRARATEAVRSAVLRDPLVRLLCGIYLLFSLAVTQLESVFAFLMMDRLGYGARDVAWLLVGMAILMGAIQGGGMRALAPRFGEKRLLLAGCALLAVGFAGVPFPVSVSVLLLPLALCAIGRAISHPPMLSMVSLAASDERRGVVMGTFQASASLARVIGPLAAGALYDVHVNAPFLLASAFMLLAGSLALWLPASVSPAAPAGEASEQRAIPRADGTHTRV
jgi:MFS family permease